MNATQLRRSLDIYLGRPSAPEVQLSATQYSAHIDKWNALEEQPDIETLAGLFYAHEKDFEKEKKIAEIKAAAAQAITEKYPLWKQINMIREGGDLSEIDTIRKKSNDIEKELDSLKTAEEIKNYKVVLCTSKF
jgi:hypothetical protein